mmetsp:Transcript_25717/g.67306  ORF Transcript_25717/g.67306 Transcript_25717/m.67306 type:complete len:173 (-) Transcript_25717:140-658(-)|eukprot:CAMPEP_0194523424 /NCGR_PEP_ID=MMETSP0253-20130528/58310_1 /TAXON_ID=2966 /ORGANISM="Noctiluca scintillans" /LENGTH=172 /DNA_ID=CAMNT_0039367961 /DNA_START=10 /DNA_END=528 /DNA_ORIENTATION=+
MVVASHPDSQRLRMVAWDPESQVTRQPSDCDTHRGTVVEGVVEEDGVLAGVSEMDHFRADHEASTLGSVMYVAGCLTCCWCCCGCGVILWCRVWFFFWGKSSYVRFKHPKEKNIAMASGVTAVACLVCVAIPSVLMALVVVVLICTIGDHPMISGMAYDAILFLTDSTATHG